MLQAFFTRPPFFITLSLAAAPLVAQGQILTGPSSYVSIEAPSAAGFTLHNYRVYWESFGLSNPGGFDLLQLIFGNDEILLSVGSPGVPPRYRIGDGADHYEVQRYGFGDFVDTFAIGGFSASQDFIDFDPSWAYFEGTNASGTTWMPSMTGAGGRAVADGSYDGWVLSSFDASFNPTSSPSSTTDNWRDAIIIAAVPEPGRACLIILGLFWLQKRRRRQG